MIRFISKLYSNDFNVIISDVLFIMYYLFVPELISFVQNELKPVLNADNKNEIVNDLLL